MFYSPRKTFLWYTGGLQSDTDRRGISIDYEVRKLANAGFCEGEAFIDESGAVFSPVRGWGETDNDIPSQSYLPNRVCEWVISAPYGHRINVKFDNVLIQKADRITVDDECVRQFFLTRTESIRARPLDSHTSAA